jgi:hypothetical protein
MDVDWNACSRQLPPTPSHKGAGVAVCVNPYILFLSVRVDLDVIARPRTPAAPDHCLFPPRKQQQPSDHRRPHCRAARRAFDTPSEKDAILKSLPRQDDPDDPGAHGGRCYCSRPPLPLIEWQANTKNRFEARNSASHLRISPDAAWRICADRPARCCSSRRSVAPGACLFTSEGAIRITHRRGVYSPSSRRMTMPIQASTSRRLAC